MWCNSDCGMSGCHRQAAIEQGLKGRLGDKHTGVEGRRLNVEAGCQLLHARVTTAALHTQFPAD